MKGEAKRAFTDPALKSATYAAYDTSFCPK